MPLERLLSLGQSPTTPNRLARYVRVTNALALLGAFLSVTAIPMDVVGAPAMVVAVDVVSTLLFMSCWYLNAGGRLMASRVVLLCAAPLSPMFQVGYAEALGLALLFLALLLVQRRRFVVLLPVIVLMSLTRPTGLAFALFLLLYFVTRIVRWRRTPDAHPLPRGEVAGIMGAGLTSFVAGLAWPAIACAWQ